MSNRTAAVAASLIRLIPLIPPISLIVAPQATAAGPLVTYFVHSEGSSLSSISYYDAEHKLQQIRDVSSPWSLTFTSQAAYPLYAVSAQTAGTDVDCQITLDGQVVSGRSASGPHSLAACSSLG